MAGQTHIFISYSSHNREFALRLADDLDRLYDVWIDREGISGGLEWEEAIKAGVEGCTVFVVIVTPDSNESDWVARETIYAEQLNKVRIPILLAGQLPFRLLNLHYVDFMANYEGGFQDLLTALSKHITPLDRQQNEADRLLGRAVRAYLDEDQPQADDLIGQVLALYPALAESPAAFWEQLTGRAAARLWAAAPMAAAMMDQVHVLEQSQPIPDYSSPDDDYAWYMWSVEINAPDDVLDQIDYVQYTLHSTFNQPPQIVRDRASGFQLQRLGWGVFEIPVEVHFKDGSRGAMDYMLTFEQL
ncbi:TIR domain-containing protein [Chloroflexota bacterium]